MRSSAVHSSEEQFNTFEAYLSGILDDPGCEEIAHLHWKNPPPFNESDFLPANLASGPALYEDAGHNASIN